MIRRAIARRGVLLAACALVPMTLPALCRADEKNADVVTDELVGQSITRGVEYLLADRNKDGNWESGTKFLIDMPVLTGAETCLCLYALLHVGEAANDPRLKPTSKELAAAIKYVIDLKPETTYVASLQASALAFLPKDPAVKDALLRTRNFLVSSTLSKGGHNYSLARAKAEPGVYDHSNSNYALMGLAAIDDADVTGVTIPANYWQLYEALWRRDQNKDGGWGYAPTKRPESYPAMTAAGVASLLLCRQFTMGDVVPSGAPRADKALENALAKLHKDYDPSYENIYYQFSLERIGLAGGFKYINGKDWYREGAGMLLKKQQPDGSWILDSNAFLIVNTTRPVFTSYALLFLARGRSPVFLNKLEYNGAWDARPRDDANVAAWVGKTFEKPLAWQSVSLKDNQDWLDAPVLFITGARDPKFAPEDVAKLRAFVEAGGIVFSAAENGSQDFTTAMRKYAGQVVDGRHEMHDLEATHPLFTLWGKVNNPPKLQGMSNGVREMWIHAPTDLGAVWQRNKPKEVKAPFEVAANLYYYACGKGSLGHRLDTLAVKPSSEPAVRTIGMARVKYNGNWDPEPGAWPRLAKLAQAKFHTTLQIENVVAAQLDAAKTPLAHLTGTAALPLDDEAKAGLKKFVDGGGTLLVDACGGGKSFAEAMKASLGGLFPDGAIEPILADSPLYAGDAPDTVKITAVDWRKYTRIRDGAPAGDGPRLLGIKRGDRWAVIFSADDITSGLLGTTTWGVAGYAPPSAQDLARNIVLYAKKDAPPNAADAK
jgi:hypothetical protein